MAGVETVTCRACSIALNNKRRARRMSCCRKNLTSSRDWKYLVRRLRISPQLPNWTQFNPNKTTTKSTPGRPRGGKFRQWTPASGYLWRDIRIIRSSINGIILLVPFWAATLNRRMINKFIFLNNLRDNLPGITKQQLWKRSAKFYNRVKVARYLSQ